MRTHFSKAFALTTRRNWDQGIGGFFKRTSPKTILSSFPNFPSLLKAVRMVALNFDIFNVYTSNSGRSPKTAFFLLFRFELAPI